MTVNVGTMQLPVPEDPDAVRTYLNGTHVSGGLWTALTRSSNHDHSGGTNGIQLTATSIPDGSITTAKLDPAVLGPYALVDGSKPFTGTVTMSADTLVRDTLRFGAKPAGVADATLSRTGPGALRADTHLGVGVNPVAWDSAYRHVQVGAAFSLVGGAAGPSEASAILRANSYYDGTSNKALIAAPAIDLALGNGSFVLNTAPSVAAGAAQTFTTRLALAPTGTLTLTPDAGQAAISAGGLISTTTADGGIAVQARDGAGAGGTTYLYQTGGLFRIAPDGADRVALDRTTGTLTLTPGAGASMIETSVPNSGAAMLLSHNSPLYLRSQVVGVMCPLDNYNALGDGTHRWTAVYAVAGAINTSSRQFKEGITPLDPVAALAAVREVVWFDFRYTPPAFTAPEPGPDTAYDASDSNEVKAEKKAARDEAEAGALAAHARMVVETAPARHQRGFVFGDAQARDEAGNPLPPVPALFGLDDRASTTPQADIATLGAGLQEHLRHFDALVARVEALETAQP